MAGANEERGLWDPWIDGGRPPARPRERGRRNFPTPRLMIVLGLAVFASVACFLLFGMRVVPQAPPSPAPAVVKAAPGPRWSATAPAGSVRGTLGPAWCLAFSPDGKMLAAAPVHLLQPCPITLWERLRVDLTDFREAHLLAGHSLGVLGLSFSPDGKTLASAGRDGTVKLWDVARGEERRLFPGPMQRSAAVAYSPDGKTLALGGAEGPEGPFVIRLWSLADDRERARITDLTAPPVTLAYSPDGKTLASAGTRPVVDLWDPETGARKAALHGHFMSVTRVAFSPDGKYLVSEGADGHVRIWDPEQGRSVADWPDSGSPTFSPDGTILATADPVMRGQAVRLREVSTGKIRALLPDVSIGLAFAPDGAFLASAPAYANGGDTLRFWDVARWAGRARSPVPPARPPGL